MEVTKEQLMQRMQELSSEELVRHFLSGTLTPLALEVAASLLRSRGIPPADPAAIKSFDAGWVLEEADSEARPEPEPDLVTVADCLPPLEASLLRGCLESHGIYVYVWGEHVAQAQVVPTAGGGARLQVRRDQLAQAQSVLAAYERGDLTLPSS